MSLTFVNYPLETFTPTASGALATIVWECCRCARREGAMPYVITRASTEARFDWPAVSPIPYEEAPRSSVEVNYRRLERKLAGWRHLRYWTYAVQVLKVIREKNLAAHPMVVLNDPEMLVILRRRFPKAFLVHWFFNHMEAKPKYRRLFAQSADVYMAVSDFTARYVADYYSVRDKPVHTVYIAADREQFHPSEENHDGLPTINFVGRTGIEKAPDLLLKAALRLSARTRAFRLQILGANHWGRLEMDEYQRELCSLVASLEAKGICVRRPGHVERGALPGELRQAQIHVVPSRWDEPFALTTLEGMATGLATVASRTGGSPEAIGDAGFLFERDSDAELAELLHPLITDAALRRTYGLRAHERSRQFTWERTWRTLKEVIGV